MWEDLDPPLDLILLTVALVKQQHVRRGEGRGGLTINNGPTIMMEMHSRE